MIRFCHGSTTTRNPVGVTLTNAITRGIKVVYSLTNIQPKAVMSYHDLNIPVSSSTVSVKVFDTAKPGAHLSMSIPAAAFFEPILPSHEHVSMPILAFLVEHKATGNRIMFDLGIRSDIENANPHTAVLMQKLISRPDKDVIDQMEAIGVERESIKTVIWSHTHFDHIGDMTKLPASTNIVIHRDMELETWDKKPSSILLPSDIAGHNITRIDFTASPLKLGSFDAFDYFGDGSFYLLDVPGHQLGHMGALARVTPTTFLFLGGDAAHHPGLLRPTAQLHANYPFPASASPSISEDHFGSGDFTARTTPLLTTADTGGKFHADAAATQRSVLGITAFDGNPDVWTLCTHDDSLRPFFEDEGYPVQLDKWKAQGWKEKTMWAFLDEQNPAFRFK
ncbi:Metallo-beta-lactamase superfamily protein [Mycena kentingensis (nom. inval.)]|nr:Metallo-beta-lactamase superfamily protein [Mycena kentingensis (nom. inval.)]